MKSKVLIVDDQADVRDLLRSVLEDNYDVAQAASGAALQKCFPQDPPDVVLLDVKLPDADGLDLSAAGQKTLARNGSDRAHRPWDHHHGGRSWPPRRL